MQSLSGRLAQGDRAILEIPSDVAGFIKAYIQSAWHLDLLLWVKNANRPVAIFEIADALYISTEAATLAVEYFVRKGLMSANLTQSLNSISQDPGYLYFYNPGNERRHELILQTEKLYAQRRVAIINFIFSKPLNFTPTPVIDQDF